ncbi:hypothetical protein N7532_001799 [Penicillium argentinense]|uniref:BTB domain transcription factor n=1 Tax=Penicillium argentinense TaxID=1131581 RepID=A0A9W9G361_9EURO|nr:uncharacterized protein N7532_001799 [Penicillium argentinense]KAJ5111264.1 hypothetical protein N7532_001799 [Penicillium argentinense]
MATRTSSRHAAQKAKEAITTSAEASTRTPSGSKRKAPEKKDSEPKKEQKVDQPPEPQPEVKQKSTPAATTDSIPDVKAKEEEKKVTFAPTPESNHVPSDRPKSDSTVEAGVHTSQKREDIVPSNILEKGIIYFFYRPRVNVDEPHSVNDVARSFFVLRPTPLGAEFDQSQGSVDKDARCRLLMLPKKKLPTSPKERDMGFVEKTGQTMKDLQEKFIASSTYQTSTRGERTIKEARPYAEGVYALTSTKRATHLAYVLTIPSEPAEIQENFGLHKRGSWIVQSKNPKFPGPAFAQLPKEPEYPPSVREKFGDLRWVPLEPEFIEYPNAQFLMIGEAQDTLGKAATAEGAKKAHEEEPGEELEKLERENEERVEALQGDHAVYEDLGLHAKKYASVPTTWNT